MWDNCDYIFPRLCNAILRVLVDVPVVEIHRYARCAFRYMDAYRIGLIGKTTKVAVKKYHSYDILGAGMLWKPKDLHKIR